MGSSATGGMTYGANGWSGASNPAQHNGFQQMNVATPTSTPAQQIASTRAAYQNPQPAGTVTPEAPAASSQAAPVLPQQYQPGAPYDGPNNTPAQAATPSSGVSQFNQMMYGNSPVYAPQQPASTSAGVNQFNQLMYGNSPVTAPQQPAAAPIPSGPNAGVNQFNNLMYGGAPNATPSAALAPQNGGQDPMTYLRNVWAQLARQGQ